MGKRLTVAARVYDAGFFLDPRNIEAVGRYGQTLRELIKAGDEGITAQEVSSWALRMSHYIDVLRKDSRYRLHIETVMEGHEVPGMGPGQHARYILRTRCELIDDMREAA